MGRAKLAFLGAGLLAAISPTAPAQTQTETKTTTQTTTRPGGAAERDADATKRETVRGVIAGVTVEGEMTYDHATNKAQVVEATLLTVVGSPTSGQANAMKGDSAAHPRHNVYVVSVGPRTEVRDATSGGKANDAQAKATAAPSTLDKVEIGDTVEVAYTRREVATSGGDARGEMRTRRHGRHRTYYGEAASLTILAAPSHQAPASEGPGAKPNSRDDDKDKVKGADR